MACSGQDAQSGSSSAAYDTAGGGFPTSSFRQNGGRGFAEHTFQTEDPGSKLEQLRGLVDEKVYTDLVEFWVDEWVVE